MSRTNNRSSESCLVDICLLTAGKENMDIFEKCIQAILSEIPSIPSRLIVFQNGLVPKENQARQEQILSNLPPMSRVNGATTNGGFPRGANRVIRIGHAPLVLFITDDVILKPGCLDALVRRMDNPEIGICGLKLLFPPDSSEHGPAGTVQHVGHGISIRGQITHPFLGWSADNPKCCVSREVMSVTGACFMVRRRIFEQAGGFFEGYGAGYFEDVELCFTIAKLGHKVFIDTDAQAYHYVGQTMKGEVMPPLQFNEMILHTRHPNDFRWSEYEMY
jgi:O-antigen biosynthesis protein